MVGKSEPIALEPRGEASVPWELYAHDADIGVRGFGGSLEEAFQQAACALTAVITDPARVRPRQAVAIACEAPDRDLLLAEWLNALVYEMATRRMLFARYEVRTDGLSLDGTAWGEPVNRVRHEPATEVKGATLTDLKVEVQSDGRWVAQCIVDV